MTNSIKRKLVERLVVNIELQRIKLLDVATIDGETQFNEFTSYMYKPTAGGMGLTYTAPSGEHDDTVVATMLVNDGLRLRDKFTKANFQFQENPFY
jgi:hypothetical protein